MSGRDAAGVLQHSSIGKEQDMSKSIRNQLATGVAAAALAVGIFAAAPLVTDLAASQAWAQGQGQGGRGGPAESRGQGAAGGGSAVGGAPA
ncbi:hypothetical protein GXW77_16515, partial [Roseomonas alkaliterrae]|nr:hypothetical protein [Neoroseomonas alkaliterrae]